MWLRPWWPRLTLLLCRIKIPRILWPRLTLLLCRIKSLRILPFVSSLRAVDMRVSSKLLTRLDPQSFGFLLFHVFFVLYFCPAHAREVPHFACSPAKLCLKKYRSYSPSNGSKPYNIVEWPCVMTLSISLDLLPARPTLNMLCRWSVVEGLSRSSPFSPKLLPTFELDLRWKSTKGFSWRVNLGLMDWLVRC